MKIRKYEIKRTLASYISIIKGTIYKRREREPNKKNIAEKHFENISISIYEEEYSILNKRKRRRALFRTATYIKQRIYNLYQSARREEK